MSWRFLKRYTGGEAKSVVMGVRGCNGYDAGRMLHNQFEPSIVMREAQAFAQFTSMVSPRAKKPTRYQESHCGV